ncbi:MAG: DUF4832 domain-containing protein [Acidobacteria bacterium]|nr:DUF4832 domain-containing protein [Acidobacteriota bacterium]
MSHEIRIACVLFFATALYPAERVVIRPPDTGAALINPGMGWMFQHYDNDIRRYTLDLDPSDGVEEFPGVSSVYIRLAWSYIEPEEGRFNWPIVDSAAQRWLAQGKTVAFRFSCTESHRDQPYATPEWVRKAGAKGHNFVPGKGLVAGGAWWEPDYDDPIFLEKLDHFLAAAAARYDGNPEVAFIDVGSFGVWGEGHTGSSTRLPYSAATVRRHIDLYKKHFKKTLLAANDDFSNQGRGLETLTYARRQGLTLRDDSILVNGGAQAYHHAWVAPQFWPELPVVLECEHFGGSRDRGHWQDGSLYLKAIEEYHASYATVHWYPREFLKANRDLIDRINLRLGYRLQLAEASWPAEVAAGAEFAVGYVWRNAGVAPCLPGGYPALTLKDSKGGIAGVFVDEEFDARSLPVGPPSQPIPVSRGEKSLNQASRPLITCRLPPAHIVKRGLRRVHLDGHAHRHATDRPAPGRRRRPPALQAGSDERDRRYGATCTTKLCVAPGGLGFFEPSVTGRSGEFV